MTKELFICERKAHLPEHDGATGYFYYEPVRPYSDIERVLELAESFLKDIRSNCDFKWQVRMLGVLQVRMLGVLDEIQALKGSKP